MRAGPLPVSSSSTDHDDDVLPTSTPSASFVMRNPSELFDLPIESAGLAWAEGGRWIRRGGRHRDTAASMRVTCTTGERVLMGWDTARNSIFARVASILSALALGQLAADARVPWRGLAV